jgi:hypothetical protein
MGLRAGLPVTPRHLPLTLLKFAPENHPFDTRRGHATRRLRSSVGEPEKALDHLEPLLKIPYYLSHGWLKIDPNFDPLRKNPRFQKLVAGVKSR